MPTPRRIGRTCASWAVKALCTNRHLPIQMAVGLGRTDFTMDLSAPVKSIRCLAGPTLPGALTWPRAGFPGG